MATTKMSVTRALTEVKTLDKRIRDAIANINPIGAHQKGKPVSDHGTVEKYNEAKRAEFQSLRALLLRKMNIECALCLSNANTKVIIQGVEYTVAQLVKFRDAHAEYNALLIERLQYLYATTHRLLEQKNTEVQARLDNLLQNHFGKDTNKVAPGDYDAIAKPFLMQNEYELLDPCNVAQLIENCQAQELAFSNELDYTLSESNSTTFIEVED